MARTWSLHDTMAITALPNIAQNAGLTAAYFIADGAQVVYSYDGVAETDISGSAFSGNNYVYDLVYFNSTLYAAVIDAVDEYAYIYKWNGGGTSWTAVYSSAQYFSFSAVESAGLQRVFAADNDRIAVALYDGTVPGGLFQILASANGTDWDLHTIESGTTRQPKAPIWGTFQTQLTTIILCAYTSTTWQRVIAYLSGSNWDDIGGEIDGTLESTVRLIGQSDGLTWWYHSGSLAYSDDYGETFSDTALSAALSYDRTVYNGSELRLMVGATAYLWNGSTWDADGTTGSDSINAFFIISGELYAFTDNDKVYDGGAVIGGGGSPYALTHSAAGIPGGILI